MTTVLVMSLLLSMLTLTFNIRSVEASGTIYIRADGSIDPDTAPISSVDNITYTFTGNIYDEIVVERNDIIIDGIGYVAQGAGGIGIELSYRSNVTITNIEIWGFDFGVWLNHSSDNSISENTIWHNNLGIELHESSNNRISENTIWHNNLGIELHESSNNRISENDIVNNDDSNIHLVASSHNRISGNDITSSEGIRLEDFSNHNIISRNYMDAGIPDTIWAGLILSESSNTIIYGNSITRYDHGIYIEGCLNSKISGNSLTNNFFGIWLVDSITNSITGNNIVNNDYGIIFLGSSMNKLHHNNFSNLKQVDIGQDINPSINTWHDGSEGNYWVDYNGTDSDDDGIGDTAYIIDEYNQDDYPLMNPTTYIYHPIPVIVTVNYPTSTQIGEWATITITATNDGTTADWQTIHVSFPNNPPVENVEIVSHDLNGGAEIYPPGSTLWAGYSEYNITSIYAMVEGIHRPWYGEETHAMTVRIRPENTGAFTFYVKIVSRAEGVTYYDPTDTKDQQDEYVYPFEINVQPAHMELIEKYCPYYIFDEQEEYFPTNFYHDDTDITNNSDNYDESWPYCMYVHTVESEEYLCIQYWSYYCRDDKLWGLDVPLIGAHDHDWESVFLYFEKQDDDYIPAFTTYFRHMKFEDLKLVEFFVTYAWTPETINEIGPHPIVHVARDSHASYERTTYGYGIFVTPFPPHLVIIAIEPCDDGIELDYDDFQIIYVDEPDSWPEQFETIDAPWIRERWDWSDPVFPPPVVKFSMLSLHETGSKLHLHVFDNQSRHVGFNSETSEIEVEIPDAYYEDLGNTTFIILPTNITDFTIMVDATYAEESVEEYEITLITVRENEVVDEESMSGMIEKGEQQEFDAKLDENGEIIVIPEFPTWMILPLFMIATLLAVVLLKKRERKQT